MNQPDTSTDAAAESTFLSNIEFLTGRDPSLGSFLLTVGMVTIVFIALFQFTLPDPVSHLLTAGVVFVTVLSAIFASLLESFGYFAPSGRAAREEQAERRHDAKPWVPSGEPAAPLPPLINFDTELRAYADMFDGDLPAAFDPFVDDYLRLKTNTANRPTIASDLRADLNPIGALFEEDTDADRLYEDISRRLFRYLSEGGRHLTLDRITFYDEDDAETDVTTLGNRLGRVELQVTNEGEPAAVDVVVSLVDEDGADVASRTCRAGVLGAGATKVLDTDVFVPVDAETVRTTIRTSDPGRAVAA